MEAAQRMTGVRPQQRMVWPWVYPKSTDVLVAARLKPVATYTRQLRHNTAKTIKSRGLLEECRGEERQSRSLSCMMRWQQEMDLEADDGNDGRGGRERYFHLFYDTTGKEVDAVKEGTETCPDPRKRFMDCPHPAFDGFDREIDLDGYTW